MTELQQVRRIPQTQHPVPEASTLGIGKDCQKTTESVNPASSHPATFSRAESCRDRQSKPTARRTNRKTASRGKPTSPSRFEFGASTGTSFLRQSPSPNGTATNGKQPSEGTERLEITKRSRGDLDSRKNDRYRLGHASRARERASRSSRSARSSLLNRSLRNRSD